MSDLKNIDPAILFSIVNTQLRDGNPSLERVCEQMGWDEKELLSRMEAAAYRFDPQQNRFVSR
jgi:hypothetical protein